MLFRLDLLIILTIAVLLALFGIAALLVLGGKKIMGDLSRLTADVAAQGTVIESAKTAFAGLAQEIRDLQAGDQTAIDALADKVEAQSTDLANAVTANTPAAPAPTPAPPTV